MQTFYANMCRCFISNVISTAYGRDRKSGSLVLGVMAKPLVKKEWSKKVFCFWKVIDETSSFIVVFWECLDHREMSGCRYSREGDLFSGSRIPDEGTKVGFDDGCLKVHSRYIWKDRKTLLCFFCAVMPKETGTRCGVIHGYCSKLTKTTTFW